MSFKLIYENKEEIKDIPNDNFTIKDLLNELELSSQTMVAKKNNELVIEEASIEDGDEIKLIQIIYGG